MTNIMRGQASSLGTLNKATKAGWLPVINGQRYTINIIVVLVLTFAMYAYLKYSKQGYEISVVGESENTARYARHQCQPRDDPYYAAVRCHLRPVRLFGCGR